MTNRLLLTDKARLMIRYACEFRPSVEVGGFGKVVIDGNDAIVTDIFIPPHEVGGAHIDIPTDSAADFWTEVKKNGCTGAECERRHTAEEACRAGQCSQEGQQHEELVHDEECGAGNIKDWCLWWHSHANMGTSPSGTDTSTLEDFAREWGFGHMFGLVSNARAEYTAWLTVGQPWPLTQEKLTVGPASVERPRLKALVDAMMEGVKQKSYQSSSSKQTSGPQSMLGDDADYYYGGGFGWGGLDFSHRSRTNGGGSSSGEPSVKSMTIAERLEAGWIVDADEADKWVRLSHQAGGMMMCEMFKDSWRDGKPLVTSRSMRLVEFDAYKQELKRQRDARAEATKDTDSFYILPQYLPMPGHPCSARCRMHAPSPVESTRKAMSAFLKERAEKARGERKAGTPKKPKAVIDDGLAAFTLLGEPLYHGGTSTVDDDLTLAFFSTAQRPIDPNIRKAALIERIGEAAYAEYVTRKQLPAGGSVSIPPRSESVVEAEGVYSIMGFKGFSQVGDPCFTAKDVHWHPSGEPVDAKEKSLALIVIDNHAIVGMQTGDVKIDGKVVPFNDFRRRFNIPSHLTDNSVFRWAVSNDKALDPKVAATGLALMEANAAS